MPIYIPRFQHSVPLVDSGGMPTQAFHVWWQEVAKNIEDQFTDVENALADITQLQSDMSARISEITTLQNDMQARINEIQEVLRNDSISSSWTSPGIILTGKDAGTDATIDITLHTRKYGDATSASVNAGSITGLAYSTTYYVYYDQISRAGGTVTYVSTTNPNIALPNAAIGRHFCGEVITPAAGGGDTSGGVSPPGSGGSLDGTDIP